jgi:hypothetical protein
LAFSRLQLSIPGLQLSISSLQLSIPSLQLPVPRLQFSLTGLQLSLTSLQLPDPRLQFSLTGLYLSLTSLQLPVSWWLLRSLQYLYHSGTKLLFAEWSCQNTAGARLLTTDSLLGWVEPVLLYSMLIS